MSHQNQMFTPCNVPEITLAVQLVPILTQANHILIEEYQRYCHGQQFYIDEKGDDSPVTQADLRVNDYLVNAIAQLCPDIPMLSEESDYSQREQWDTCWLLDPLDGTREFIAKRDKFTINLSLIEQQCSTLSIISVPHEQVIYVTDGQQLPYKYDVLQQQWLQYDLNKRPKRPALHIAVSHGSHHKKYTQFMDYIQQHQQIESFQAGSAYKFCMMLEGLIDIYPRFHPTSEWDTSAGQGLLESIGGGLLTLDQKPFLYNVRPTLLNKGFIAVTDKALFELAFQAVDYVQQQDKSSG